MNEIEQTYERHYPELGYAWEEATQIVDVETNKVIERTFSFLDWQEDYRVSFTNKPPVPIPYGSNARGYFTVVRTVYNTIYEGAESGLEIEGEEIESAIKFNQWKQTRIEFDYEQVWLDVEAQSISWRSASSGWLGLLPGDGFDLDDIKTGDYILVVNDKIVRSQREDSLVLTIPSGFWGIRGYGKGMYLTDDPNAATGIPLTGSTQLITKPYLKFTKPKYSDASYTVSLRGIKNEFLPGDFIAKAPPRIRAIDFPRRLPRSQRLIPPFVTWDGSFEELKRENPEAILARNSLNWVVQ